MYKLVVTELAHQDLDNIVSYIAIQLANPVAASDFLDKVDKCYGYQMRAVPGTVARLAELARVILLFSNPYLLCYL
jgi:plasmid stabilization system protein ParE